MKVIEHLEKSRNKRIFSFEIVPPPRGRSVHDVAQIVESLSPLDPAWIDVTSHASNAYFNEKSDGTIEKRTIKKRPGTIGICGVIQNRFKIDTVAHILCEGFTKEETEDALIELNYLGIHNVLALKGDTPNYQKPKTNSRPCNQFAKDLVEQISNLKQGVYQEEIVGSSALDFCVGVAGYPEKHFEAPNDSLDVFYLKQKVDAGAEYIVTQMFFDNQKYFSFVERCRSAGINVPIIPGLKILKSVAQLKSLPKNFYIDIPEDLSTEVMRSPEHVIEIGKNWAKKQCQELIERGVPALHFYVMNDASSVVDIASGLK